MTKKVFLHKLRNKLSDLPKSDRGKTVEYYSEMLDDRMDEGLSEEEAVAAVGAVDEIASQIISDCEASRSHEKTKCSNVKRVLLAIGFPVWGSLLLGAVVVVLSLYLAVWAIIVSLYASDIAVLASGIFGYAYLLANSSPLNANIICFTLGIAMICVGVSVLLFFALNAIVKRFNKLTKTVAVKTANRLKRKGE